MPRTEVYQLRLTRQEKDSLAAQAKDEKVSIAKLIRWRLGLDLQDEEPKVSPTPPDEGSTFTNLVAKNKLRMSTPAAERRARKELEP